MILPSRNGLIVYRIPAFVRNRCHAVLTAAWTHNFPIIQKSSPAKLAAAMVLRTLEEIGYDDTSKISIVDFCSGAGGPIPTIERLVNEKRAEKGQKPIPFLLTDIRPHLEAWMAACAESDNLSFIPQSVDATNPPIAVTSIQSSTTNANGNQNGRFSSDTRIFRLYCLSFHHFTDDLARKVLRSTVDTADGFAIIELQDRHLSSLLLICGFFPLQFLTTLSWFWRDPLHLFLTYIVPVVPFIVTFDGLVSCLRTRSFEEVMKLVGSEGNDKRITSTIDEDGKEIQKAERGQWVFTGTSEVHTWPFGYTNWVVGYKKLS
ncbi:hypothetical protein EJ08DRAFT_586122 [Tothia fuscella]|uniref:Uncharacterized protein n=1 Tax=Tothia fuscella TaxID=1048955 RepID=A0A9P4NUP2_9PEZI|nr:hypothetical protein EJ08DRAFT_586122 [Tothia fuscella]